MGRAVRHAAGRGRGLVYGQTGQRRRISSQKGTETDVRYAGGDSLEVERINTNREIEVKLKYTKAAPKYGEHR